MITLKKNIGFILSLLVPIIIVLIAIFLNDFYPFGNKLLLMVDGLKQYPGFLGSFIDIIKNQESIFYSFGGLLGFNYLPVAAYYLFNITNIFSIFFDKADLASFYTIVIILKFGLASLTMFIFLYYKNNDYQYNLLFAFCYGLTAYNILYYFNYMWFDSIIIFPLVMLGIDKIINDKKYLFYILTLFLAIIFNYYIGYIICIFSVIYFIFKYITENIQDKTLIFKYIIFSLLALLLGSFILLPSLLELLNGKALLFDNYVNEYFKFDFDFLNVFYKLSIASYMNGDLSFGTPNVYVSIFIVVNVCLYFINPKIKKKEKIVSAVIISFFLLSMSFNLLDYFFHMMQKPIWYQVRYAFVFDFFLIFLAYKNFINEYSFKKKALIITTIILFGLMLLGSYTAGVYEDSINIFAKLIYLGITLLFIIYYLLFLNDSSLRKYLIIVLIIELTLNTFLTIKNNGNDNNYNDFNDSLTNHIKIVDSIDNNSFYRASFDQKITKNDGLLMNYNDISYFSSVRNHSTISVLKDFFNLHTNEDCNVTYFYNNPLVNSILSIKYYSSKNNLDYYQLENQIDNNYLYFNKDATSIGFLTNKNILNLKSTSSFVENMNNLHNTLTNKNNIIKEIKYSDKNVECYETVCISENSISKTFINYTVNKTEEGFYFIQNDYPYSKEETSYETKINGKLVASDNNIPFYTKKGDNIEINIYPEGVQYKDYDYHVYFIKMNDYLDFIEAINKENFILTDFKSDSNFKGQINVIDNNILFTSIAFDKGWKVFVNGKEKKIEKILDGLIGIELNQGENIIEFKYFTPGLKTGIIISISSLSLIIIYSIRIKKKK